MKDELNTHMQSVNTFGAHPPEGHDHRLKRPPGYRIAIGASGPNNAWFKEPVPQYHASDSEKTPAPIQGANNTWIILGRDRVDNRASGYGGKGHTQCGAIDIVVGLDSPYPRGWTIKDKKPHQINVNRNFVADAARIYISQKTDVDDNFNLSANPKMLENSSSRYPSRERSAIAIKADAIRIIAREGIKLVTRTDEINSRGGKILATRGIDLVAGNNAKDLQPMVRGENLAAALEGILDLLRQLSGLVYANINNQASFNTTMAGHIHATPAGGAPTAPSIPAINNGIKTTIATFKNNTMGAKAFGDNMELYRGTFISSSATQNIRSKYNNVN